jgi:hypothetical protein
MVAVKLPTGGGSGCGAGAVGGLTNGATSEELLVFASLFVEEREPSLTVGLLTPFGAAMAAKGVIRIVNDRRQAKKTRRLPAAGSGDNCFTTYLILERGLLNCALFLFEQRTEKSKILFDERQD